MADTNDDANLQIVQISYAGINSALSALVSSLPSTTTASGNPVGTILSFAGTTVPSGYLACNGAQYDVKAFPQLYAILQSPAVPDLRGLFLRGIGGQSSALLTKQNGTLISAWSTSSMLPQDNSPVQLDAGVGLANINVDPVPTPPTLMPSAYVTQASGIISYPLGYTSSPSTSAPLYGVTRPSNASVNYIIKAST